MERLTYIKCPHWWGHGRNPTPYSSRETFQTVCDRLGTIEDILGEEYDLDRLRELVEADKEGRCEVLQKPIGSDVYRIEYVKSSNGFEIGIKKHKFDYVFFAFERKNIGKTVFFDREAAEAALKERQDGGQHD